MWHFGRDKKYEYTRDGYCSLGGRERSLTHVYTRSINGQKVQRKDRQEYPDKPFLEAVNRKRSYEITEVNNDN